MEEKERPAWLRWGGVLLCLAAFVMVGLWLKDFLGSAEPPKKQGLQQITLIKPPPPPPPPEQKPPEPVVKEEIKISEPDPEPMDQADEPPPGPDLAVDAEGTGSGDSFGLVGKKGGSDLIGSGRGGNPWAWYDGIVNEAINSAFQDALAREQALKDKSYKVIVKVWIDARGQISRVVLGDTTGDAKVDQLLKDVLQNLRALREAPPADMPQPIKIRVTSRA
jgi:protein TonB